MKNKAILAALATGSKAERIRAAGAINRLSFPPLIFKYADSKTDTEGRPIPATLPHSVIVFIVPKVTGNDILNDPIE